MNPATCQFQLLWSKKLPNRLRGLRLARELSSLLAWDQSHWIFLLNQLGETQARFQHQEPITDAAIAEDASVAVLAGQNGALVWLSADLSPVWQKRLTSPPQVLGLAPLGSFVAVADQEGQVLFFDPTGEEIARCRSPRPLHHLAFVPSRPALVGCADFGLVGAFDRAGTWQWRDAPVVHTGSLAVSGDGSYLVLACFSEGLFCYGPDGKKLASLIVPQPCGLVCVSYAGDIILAASLTQNIYLLDQSGRILAQQESSKSLAAIALSPLGDKAYLACKEGDISAYKIVAG